MGKRPFIPKNGIEREFAFLCAIAHPSKGEKALGTAIAGRCRAKGLEAQMDRLGNLLVRKPASPGCEQAPTVILQAHMDMVCSKEAGYEHDFQKDPLRLYVDEKGWLGAEGTSLGADDGYGMAYMLDILLGEDASKHPALECLFTVQEEIGLLGAAGFDARELKGKLMISMDSEGEMETVVSTAGGERLDSELELKGTRVQGRRARIAVGGLSGGHSAEAIHKGRANAIKLLSYLLVEAEALGAALIALEGGEAPNAIARNAWAEICVAPEAQLASLQSLGERYRRLYGYTDPQMRVTVEDAGQYQGTGYGLEGAKLIALWPDGVCYMDQARHGVVEASDNLGVARLESGKIILRTMLRSIGDEWLDELEKRMRLTASLFGANCRVESVYPGMRYQQQSRLRQMYAQLVREETGAELSQRSTHGGMEVGYFATRIPGVDIVSLACNAQGCHSPSERMELASFQRVYGRLRRLLERLAA